MRIVIWTFIILIMIYFAVVLAMRDSETHLNFNFDDLRKIPLKVKRNFKKVNLIKILIGYSGPD